MSDALELEDAAAEALMGEIVDDDGGNSAGRVTRFGAVAEQIREHLPQQNPSAMRFV